MSRDPNDFSPHLYNIGDRIYLPMINEYFTIDKRDYNTINDEPCYSGISDSGQKVVRCLESWTTKDK